MLLGAFVVLCALLLDRMLGEVKQWHPLVAFGHYAESVLAMCYPPHHSSAFKTVLLGAIAWLACVLPWVIIALLLDAYLPYGLHVMVSIGVLYFAIGARSLAEHADQVYAPLSEGDIQPARIAVANIVSRDTHALTDNQVATATVETVVENTHDAVIAPIVWFLLFGMAGVVLFRLSNTLDAMWGYKNTRFIYFGRFSARVDDVLGWFSARVTVALFAIFNWRALLQAYTLGRQWYSPNAGPVMAAGGAVLNLQLGGAAVYHGAEKPRPLISEGESVSYEHIKQAVKLMYRATYMLVAILFLLGAIQWLY